MDRERIEKLHNEYLKNYEKLDARQKKSGIIREVNLKYPQIKGLGFFRRFGALFGRAWRQNIRDSRVNVVRLFASIGQALLFSQIFKSIRKGPPLADSLADRTAMLSFGTICMSMVSLLHNHYIICAGRLLCST